MVTNPLYKSYSKQIAKLFCSENQNKILCEASIEGRLNTFLDDVTYPIFLSKLNSGRQYVTTVEQLQNKGFRIVIVDLITGERATAWWEHAWNLPYLSKIPTIFLSHQFNIISANKTFNDENKYDVRITWNPIKVTYGITFVPQQPPNYVPPSGGGGGYEPPSGGGGGGGTIQTIPPTQTQGTTPTSGFDISKIIKPEYALIGIGVLALYMFMKK